MFTTLTKFLVLIIFLSYPEKARAERFVSSYSCNDQIKTCLSSGNRIIDGFEVNKDCFEYSYKKVCDYPSKNDCRLYEHCYLVNILECLLNDSLGNCVNQKKEFSCESTIFSTRKTNKARVEIEAKEEKEGLVCEGIPCFDGNCVDKSYEVNEEMMESISRLYAFSNMKPNKDHNFNLFPGFIRHCSKKATGYSNCCTSKEGWGMQIGAKCSEDEINLMNLRSKNLCVSVGIKKSKIVTKHYFCCFGSMLNKVVQVEGRKQLGLSFGSGKHPDCRGLTLDEIAKLDFSKMDFSEIINELTIKFTGSYNAPSQQEIGTKIENHMKIKKYDDSSTDKENKLSGVNDNLNALDKEEYE